MRAAQSAGNGNGRGPPAFAVILIGCALMDRYPSQARMCRGCCASESNKYGTSPVPHQSYDTRHGATRAACQRNIKSRCTYQMQHMQPTGEWKPLCSSCVAINARPEWRGAKRVKMQTGAAIPRPLQTRVRLTWA